MALDVGPVAKGPVRLEEAVGRIAEQILRAVRRDAETREVAVPIGEIERRGRRRIGDETRLRPRGAGAADAIGGETHIVVRYFAAHLRRGIIGHDRRAEIGVVVPLYPELKVVGLDLRDVDERNDLGRLRTHGSVGQHAIVVDIVAAHQALRFALAEREFDRSLARVDLQVRMEILRADLEFVGGPEIDPERRAPTPPILVTVGDIAIFGGIIVGRDGRGIAAPLGKGPVAAIVAAEHIDVIVRPLVAERRDDPEPVVEIIAEHRRAGGFPAADFAALAHLEIARGGQPVLQVERVAGLEIDDTAEAAFE